MTFDESPAPIIEHMQNVEHMQNNATDLTPVFGSAPFGSASPAPHTDGGTIEQVRELLFGPARRENDQRIQELHEAINALRADMMSLFSDLEARMADGDAAVERRHLSATQGIGSAIASLGAEILKISEPSSG
jgi:hypothetical protein